MIDFSVLGPTVLRVDGRDAHSILAQPKRLAVLAWIAIAGARGLIRRESIMAMFWADLDDERARAAVRQALHMARQSLGADALVTVGSEEVGLSPAVRCDAIALERAAEAGDHEQVLALYRGELLAGLHLDGVPDFERWLDGERDRLRDLAARSALAAAGRAEAEGRLQDAVAAAARGLEIDPLGEAALRRLLELLQAAGERPRALRTFEEWRTRLAEELGVEPSPETLAVAQRLSASPPALVKAGTSFPPHDVGSGTDAGVAGIPGDAGAAVIPTHGDAGPGGTAAASAIPVAAATPLPARRRWPVVAAAIVLTTVAVAALAFVREPQAEAAPPVSDQRVLVLAFENRTGDAALDAVGVMASDWIVQGLAHTELVDVVSASDLVASSLVAKLERGAAAAAAADPPAGANAAPVARATGAAFVVTGAYYRQGGRLHFQAQVTARDGRLITALEPVDAAVDDPLTAVETLREQTMAALAPHVHPRLRTWAPAMARPPRYDAYLAFVDGVSLHNQSRWREAAEQHGRATALAPDFMQAHIWMAKSYLNLSDYRAADSIARLIAPRRHRLNFMDRLMLDWIEATVRGDNAGRLASVRELHRRVPGAELVRYQLGYELVRTERPQEAIAVFEGINPDFGFMSGWHHYWTQYTAALHLAGEHDRELHAARQARQRFPGSIRVFALEAYALAARGDTAALRVVAGEIVAAGADGPAHPFGVLVQTAAELRAHGHAAAAAELAARALRAHAAGEIRGHGEEEGAALLLAGRPRDALDAQRRRVAKEPASVTAWGTLGVAAVMAGDTAAARDAAARLDRLASDAPAGGGPTALPGRARFQQARIAAALGSPEAGSILRRAAAGGMPYGPAVHAALPTGTVSPAH